MWFKRALERAKQQIAFGKKHKPEAQPARVLKRVLVEKNGRELFLAVERLDWARSEKN